VGGSTPGRGLYSGSVYAAFRAGAGWLPWLAVAALVAGFLTLYSMSILWTQAFWQTPPGRPRVIRRIPPAMLAALALVGACTLGIGLAVEPVSRLARDAALQMMPTTATRAVR
jgi:multicomponent Na+:H+ antiporter subunit D